MGRNPNRSLIRKLLSSLDIDKLYGPEGFSYKGKEAPQNILRKLESAGIPTNWVSQDIPGPRNFLILPPTGFP
jgi:hypothetical protein